MGYAQLLLRSKGLTYIGRRAWAISRRYGLTSRQMERALKRFIATTEQYDCRPTLPIVAVVLARNPEPVRQLQARGIEFAVHGLTHSALNEYPVEKQREQLRRALDIFSRHGVQASGLRSPYLNHNQDLHQVAASLGFQYTSNQSILWDVEDGENISTEAWSAYQRALTFYVPWLAKERLAVPRLHKNIVEIPVSLPDDEMLIDRFNDSENSHVRQAWTRILQQTHARGELFTLQLHPERIFLCLESLSTVLSQARQLQPPVWIARLDEIAAWWQSRCAAEVTINEIGSDTYRVSVDGPDGTALLARGVEINGPGEPWAEGYQLMHCHQVVIRCKRRPFVGLAPNTSPVLVDFLRQQGFITEISLDSQRYSIYFDRLDFVTGDERAVYKQIEASNCPLVRLNRWPDGAHSALAVTGDIDALSVWDYIWRMFGA